MTSPGVRHVQMTSPEHKLPEVEPRELPENRDYQFRSDGKKPGSTETREKSNVGTKASVNNQPKKSDVENRPEELVQNYPRSDGNITLTTNSMVDAHSTRVSDVNPNRVSDAHMSRASIDAQTSRLTMDARSSHTSDAHTSSRVSDAHTSRASEMYDYYKYSSRIERPGDQADRLSFGRYVESQGLSPIHSDIDRPDSAVSSTSRRSAGASPSLRPYRPAGSTEVYYVESGADDNASVTTMESTHADSDDAVGPHFPRHVLGSRADPNVNSIGIYGNQLKLSRSASPPKQLDPIMEGNSFAENTRNNNNKKEKEKSDTGSDKSSERAASELSDSMNAETVIAKHNRSANNKSISSDEFAQEGSTRSHDTGAGSHDRSTGSHDPSIKSQDGDLSRDASVKSHDPQNDTALASSGGISRDQTHPAPSNVSSHDNLDNLYVSDHIYARQTDALFKPWDKPFGDEILDIKQYQGKDAYELRLRVREQEAIQMMIEKHKELLRQREEEEMRLREKIRREIEEESQRYRHQKSGVEDQVSGRIDETSGQLYFSGDKTMSGREFRTPERHTPDINQSEGRSRSHDQRASSGYSEERQNSTRGGKTSYEINETQAVRGDRSSSKQGQYHQDPRGLQDEFYSHRRSPYGAINPDGDLGGVSLRKSPYSLDAGVTRHSESDRGQSDEFQPLQAEQDTDSSPDPPQYTSVKDAPGAPTIPQLPNKYHFKDGSTTDRVQDEQLDFNRSAKEPLERSVLDTYLQPVDVQPHRLSRSLDLPKHTPRLHNTDYQSVRYQRDLELEKLQSDIRRRREEVEDLKIHTLRGDAWRGEVEQLKLQSLREDGLPGNINSLWDRFNKVMSGGDSTLSEASIDVSTASSSSIDMGRLKDLLKNPGKYLVKYLQENPQLGSSFTVPMETGGDKKQVNFDSDLNERRHYDKDGFIDKKARRKQYERSREQYADTSTTSSQNLSSSEFMDMSSDDSTSLTDTTVSSTQSNGSFVVSKKRKYLNGQDSDTLPSIPEDSTLESTTDVTLTTDSESVKGQGHRDPKMAQLQQKIKRQKEIHEKERRRENKRKEKIVKLEKLLAQKSKDDVTRRRSTSPKKTSTPSGARHSTVLEGPPTPTMSEITSSSTMVGSSTLSDDTIVEEMDTRGQFTRPEDDSESSACPCRSSYTPVLTPKATPLSGRKKSPEQPVGMTLREVNYSRSRQQGRVVKESGRDGKDTKQCSNREERERTFTTHKNVRHSARRDTKRDMERERERSRSGKREKSSEKRESRSRSGERRVASFSAQAQPTSRDVSVNCPSPIVRSPPTRRKKQDVTMISEAVQTSFHKRSCPRHGTVVNSSARNSAKHQPASAFTPETSDLSAENIAPSTGRDRTAHRERAKAKAGQSGFAWYIPLGEPRPWRKPLRERQQYADAVETASRRNKETLASGGDPGKPAAPHELLGKSPYCDPDSKPSLQEEFSKKKIDFITRSRERQRIITLKAMERKMSELHQLERVQLFSGEPRHPHPQGYEPHPFVERLFKPQKRVMSRREMKDLNAKVYRRLPEVTQAALDKRRQQEYRTNRVRAQMFKQKVLNRLLYKKAAWVQ